MLFSKVPELLDTGAEKVALVLCVAGDYGSYEQERDKIRNQKQPRLHKARKTCI